MVEVESATTTQSVSEDVMRSLLPDTETIELSEPVATGGAACRVVKPGMSGLAQIVGGYEVRPYEKSLLA